MNANTPASSNQPASRGGSERPIAATPDRLPRNRFLVLAALVLFLSPVGMAAAAPKDLSAIVKGDGTALNPYTCVGGTLAQGDPTFPETGEFYDHFDLNWPGGDLTVALSSTEFNAYLIVYEPPGFIGGGPQAPDVNDPDNPFASEVYSKTNAPAGRYSFFITTQVPGETGEYSFCNLPLLHLDPGACSNGTLTPDDFVEVVGAQNYYFDTYYLDWPGGPLNLTLDSSQFDEYLIVYPPPGEGVTDRVVRDESFTSPEVYQVSNSAPGIYQVRVSTAQPLALGNYSLCLGPACVAPNAVANPLPADTATGVATDVTLSWSQKARAEKVIYGNDDRQEIFEVADPKLVEAYRSTVMVLGNAEVINNGNGTYSVPSQTFDQVIQQQGMSPLCSDERFKDQPSPGICSGFLVGPDLVVTAGHCLTSNTDLNHAFVFGFEMLDANTPVLTFPSDNVYFAQQVVDRRLDSMEDWALIRLDRPVVGRTPLPIRHSGVIPDNQALVLISYPFGLPAKVSAGANVRTNETPQTFIANLDSYGGSSGGAVLNADTLVVEAIVKSGEDDFVDNGTCTRSKVCGDLECKGETVMRTTNFSDLVPPVVEYQVFLGPVPGQLQFLGSTAGTQWMPAGLAADTQYQWQVVAKSDCGETPGPVWTFRTLPGGTPNEPIANFDVMTNNTVDARDLLQLLNADQLGRPRLFNFAEYWKGNY